MDLNAIRIFVKVVQVGSFVQAARQLGIPGSTASAKLSALEQSLGVTLLQRTTRKLHLTQAGEAYFQHCLRALDEISSGEAQINSALRDPQGQLKVTAPIDWGGSCLMGLLSNFRKKYPKVNLEFNFTDQMIDLVGQGFDFAIRAGSLKDSGLIAKRLGFASWVPFASPGYLKKAGIPSHPKDLSTHACIHFTPFGEEPWTMSKGISTVKVPTHSPIAGNDLHLSKALCLAGFGVALLPTFVCQAEIAAGKLIQILPEWSAYSDPIHLLYPRQKFISPKVRAFIEVAVVEFKSILQG